MPGGLPGGGMGGFGIDRYISKNEPAKKLPSSPKRKPETGTYAR